MIDLKLDINHDIHMDQNGDLVLVGGLDAIGQNLDQELEFWLGEWFLDILHGVPYRQVVFVKNSNPDIVQAVLLETIFNSDGIVQVNDFAFSYTKNNRGLGLEFVAQSTNGEIVGKTQVGI